MPRRTYRTADSPQVGYQPPPPMPRRNAKSSTGSVVKFVATLAAGAAISIAVQKGWDKLFPPKDKDPTPPDQQPVGMGPGAFGPGMMMSQIPQFMPMPIPMPMPMPMPMSPQYEQPRASYQSSRGEAEMEIAFAARNRAAKRRAKYAEAVEEDEEEIDEEDVDWDDA